MFFAFRVVERRAVGKLAAMLASIVDDEPINPGPFAGIVRARTRVFSDEKFEFVLEKRDVDVMRLRFRVPFRGAHKQS